MKNSLLILGAVAMTAITLNAVAGDALLSPRAASNQIKHVTGISADANLVSVDHYTVTTPRTTDNAIAKTASAATGAAAMCSNMAGSPKMIAECASHPGASMACCKVEVADAK